MRNVLDIFGQWPSDADLVRDLGLPYQTVVAWKQRGSIPAAYWRDLIRAARQRGLSGVTPELLMDLHARNSPRLASNLQSDNSVTEGLPQNGGDPGKSLPDEKKGQFSRYKHLRRSHFASAEEIVAHVRALRDEWDRR